MSTKACRILQPRSSWWMCKLYLQKHLMPALLKYCAYNSVQAQYLQWVSPVSNPWQYDSSQAHRWRAPCSQGRETIQPDICVIECSAKLGMVLHWEYPAWELRYPRTQALVRSETSELIRHSSNTCQHYNPAMSLRSRKSGTHTTKPESSRIWVNATPNAPILQKHLRQLQACKYCPLQTASILTSLG